MIYKRIPPFHIFLVMQDIIVCHNIYLKNVILKTIFQNFEIKILNSDFLLDIEANKVKLLGDVLCSLF